MIDEINGYNVDVVLVIYNPNLDLLSLIISCLVKQSSNVYIVDNTSDYYLLGLNKNCFSRTKYQNIIYIPLEKNKGIAFAQNVAINRSINDRSDFILFTDQDTEYPDNYIELMMYILKEADVNNDVALIAPMIRDMNKKKQMEGFYKKNIVLSRKIFPINGVHRIYQAISSGSIIKSMAFVEIGLMNEKLFIDWVDFEWCWRAQKIYKLIGNANMVINHRLGMASKNYFIKEINTRGPIRSYYITRNAVYLALHSKSLNYIDRVFLLIVSFKYIIGFSIINNPHGVNLKYSTLGFVHGLFSKLGVYNEY